jgi:hypothetical protein
MAAREDGKVITDKSISDLVRQRFSCRTYLEEPIAVGKQQQLRDLLVSLRVGPLGTALRFDLVAASETDRRDLEGLGTYGFIRNAPGFIVGAMSAGAKDLEDFGYLMEQAILFATDLDLGTCWLGGTFSKSNFARAISAAGPEQVPAVAAVGHIKDVARARNGLLRRQIGADSRLPWEELFFDARFREPLTPEKASELAIPLEMVRLGPSASNKQPWRVIKDGDAWHFYLQRTKGYRSGIAARFMDVADIQRLDMGIAMCHFELTARDLGLDGEWTVQEPGLARPDDHTEYTVTWIRRVEGQARM